MHTKTSKNCLFFGGEANRKELEKISLFDSTVKRRVDEIMKDIELQVLKKKQIMCFCHPM